MTSCGLMLQMDGSTHGWFSKEKSYLILAIDDASSEIYGEFFQSETTQGCLKVLKDIVRSKGIFKCLYVDRAGIFGGHKRHNFSQVKRACEELGIEIIFANSPQGKGRVERAFGTLQDRLIPELRIRGITTMSEANKFLKEDFISNHWNKQMTVQPEYPVSEYKELPSYKNLGHIFTIKGNRQVNSDHTIHYKTERYLIDIEHSIAGKDVTVFEEATGTIKAFFFKRELKLSKVIKPVKAQIESKKDKEIQKFRQPRTKVSIAIERVVLQCSLESPNIGERRLSKHLKESYALTVSLHTIRDIWVRHRMSTIALRHERTLQLKKIA